MRPVAERDRRRRRCAGPARRTTGTRPGGAASAPSLAFELERAVGGAEADARQHVDDEAQAVGAGQRVAPARAARCRTSAAGTRATSAPRSTASTSAAQRERRAPGPIAARRRRARSSQPCSMHGHAALAQPVEPALAVGRVEDGVERVAACSARHAVRRPPAGAGRGCRAGRRRRRRGRAAARSMASDCGPRLTRSPSTTMRSREGEKAIFASRRSSASQQPCRSPTR